MPAEGDDFERNDTKKFCGHAVSLTIINVANSDFAGFYRSKSYKLLSTEGEGKLVEGLRTFPSGCCQGDTWRLNVQCLRQWRSSS